MPISLTQLLVTERMWCIPGGLEKVDNNEYTGMTERRRDVIWKYNKETVCIIFGIENQSTVHDHMPIRIIDYDTSRYAKQADLHKGKVNLVVTIIFYTGKKKWNKSLRLKDYIPYTEEFESFVPEFSIHVVHIMDKYSFQTKSLQDIFNLVQCIYNKEEIDNRFEKIDVENVRIAGILTNTPYLANYEGEGEINMCREWDERIQEIEGRGEKRGVKIGEKRGVKIGEEKGLKIGEEKGLKIGEEKGLKIGEERGKKKDRIELIQKAAKKLSIQEIADLFDFDVSYVQSILN